ncbi:Flp pilus assembly complex ATPase component TadA [Luteolibacter pohnpeiensis]|uniref:Flp pilus assembly complex ATPase component TadA n=1 Tax=Luteolibacter pohnpeiensis TaxID=454153 RepID=A0A934S8T7_9BACT|nr:ATPase, T2SS/T4P/T4SS family [Luteolibacter pohnpeiensis]MBK1883455.1 Flp pilus assembly complex ATPase component TadA [Luteolibacter pohnpeiensis]
MFSNEDYLAELLTEAGMVSAEQVANARASLSGNETLVEHLLAHTALGEEHVAHTLATNAGVPYVSLADVDFNSEITSTIPADVARRYKVLPVVDDGTYLTVAVADPLDFEVLDTLPHILERELNLTCATHREIQHFIREIYGAENAASSDDLSSFSVTTGDAEAGSETGDAPVIRLVTQILTEAFRLRASDIHIEPLETSVRIRYRMDGKLVQVDSHPKKLLPPMIARLKVMSGSMSIAEKRLPQDGRIQLKMGDKEIDLRVSSVPSNHGESIVMRILDKSALVLGLPELGFFSDDQALFEQMLGLPDGILLVTGPTGSGKTTTLYACLNVINRPDKKIITVEDPVEYELPGINQVMVKADVGMTFAAALRAMLRQAPNIIMIGEIRDAETANIAINASLTGHLVFSTLHTNDAPSAVARLADIGVKPFLIASAVRAVLAQRLVRKLCPVCKAPAELTEKEIRSLSLDPTRLAEATIYGPVGCDKCRGGGYRGRMGIFEIFVIDDEVRQMINNGLTTTELRRRARELGMRTLREDGIRKVLSGLTSGNEVVHATMSDAE